MHPHPRHGILMNGSTFKIYALSRYRPVAKKDILKTTLIAILLAAALLAACTRPASTPPFTYPTRSAPGVTVEQVQVDQGTGIYLSGRSTLPNGECIKTELLEDGKKANWWPADTCVTVDTGNWEMLVGLGREGAPEHLDPKNNYEIHAWWPKNPEKVTTRFPFDLTGPKQ